MNIDDKYKWLARDYNGQLWLFAEKPIKQLDGIWRSCLISERMEETNNHYSFIKQEDEEPFELKNLIVPAIEQPNMVTKPSHYIGINGLEVEQILEEFLPKIEDSYVAHRIGSAIEYLLRSSAKNGEEDIKKAGQNIEQIIRYKEEKK